MRIKLYNQPDQTVTTLTGYLEYRDITAIDIDIKEGMRIKQKHTDWQFIDTLHYTSMVIDKESDSSTQPKGFDFDNKSWQSEAMYYLLKGDPE
jgi:hypothetical protein